MSGAVMLLKTLIAAVALAWAWVLPATAQASCAEAAARVAADPNLRVVAVQEGPRACRIRVVEQRPGRRPRSRVIVVRR